MLRMLATQGAAQAAGLEAKVAAAAARAARAAAEQQALAADAKAGLPEAAPLAP